MIIWLFVFLINIPFMNYYFIKSEDSIITKNIKFMENKTIVFDDMTILKDELVYFKCKAYNCSQIDFKTTKKFYTNPLFNGSTLEIEPRIN